VLSPEISILAIAAAGIMLMLMRALCMRQIGGQTGDVCGAVQVLTELTMLAVYVSTIR
jgi:adenosylcobinamide-GDP ribazoletransferase